MLRVGHEGQDHFMCLVVMPEVGDVRTVSKGRKKSGIDPLVDEEVMERVREGWEEVCREIVGGEG